MLKLEHKRLHQLRRGTYIRICRLLHRIRCQINLIDWAECLVGPNYQGRRCEKTKKKCLSQLLKLWVGTFSDLATPPPPKRILWVRL